MDSFYDVPRRAPPPTPVEKFLVAPVVPEVSMICPTRAPVNDFMPYHTWKMQQHSNVNRNVLSTNRENIYNGSAPSPHAQNTSHLFKKQVRFESPVLQQRPSLTYEPFNSSKRDIHLMKNSTQVCETQVGVKQGKTPLNGKTLEEIYMANVPTRQLDLSLIELPKTFKNATKSLEEVQQVHGVDLNKDLGSDVDKNKENELPRTYREFLETQKKIAKENKLDADDSVTDIFNYKRGKDFTSNKDCSGEKQVVTRLDKSMDISSKDVSAKHRQPQIKHPICVHKYSNAVDKGQVQKPLSPFNRTQYMPPQCTGIGNNDYKNQSFPKSDTETQTTIVDVQTLEKSRQKDESEPTNKDLLKIITQQNEQLLMLQKQVAMLLNRDQECQPKPIESAPQAQRTNYLGEKCVTSTQNENFRSPVRDNGGTPRKRGMSKFSIDLMTSFEVAIRPQHKQNYVNYEPKIQEITESESVTTAVESEKTDKTCVDNSLFLQEPMKVREVCPSPEPSININMNDYDSSEDDEVTASDIGATFYRNLMGQVNNILKKAQVQTREDLEAREKCKNVGLTDKAKEKTMSRVKEATLRHLKSIGVTINATDDDASSLGNDSKDYSPTEVSFAVKQILMKYLPDEQLAKITHQPVAQPCREEKPAMPTRPDFSFASIQYMKKYNLISNDVKTREAEPRPKPPQKVEGPKILDITALKMQPKLL